ncbi:MAG: hypothetical protein ACOC7K_02160 [bacterium]
MQLHKEPWAQLGDIELLDTTEAVEGLADALVTNDAVPASQPRDAFRIAIAAVYGVP